MLTRSSRSTRATKITTINEWLPRTDGDYYVGYHPVSAGQRKPKPFRLLLRAWDPRPAVRDLPAPYVRAIEEAPGAASRSGGQTSARQEDSSLEEMPIRNRRGAGARSREVAMPEAPPSQPQPASPPDTDHAAGSGQDEPHATQRFSHDVEVIALLSAAQPQSNSPSISPGSSPGSSQGNSSSTTTASAVTGRSIKVLRARRPKALAANAPDQRTFREHEPSPGLW